MIQKKICFFIVMVFAQHLTNAQEELKNTTKVEYSGFLEISEELMAYRASRLISIETFNAYSTEDDTIILDTRSKKAYDQIHIKGAIHLNFSDFTKTALSKKIAAKNSRILIYCNNNIQSSKEALMNKMRPLALNIPTFINLYAYGYKNVYELKGYLAEDDQQLAFQSITD